MSPRKSGERLSPVVRFAPPGELRVYSVYEHQLDLLAAGSPASIMFNFALFFLGVAVSAFGTLISAPAIWSRPQYIFLTVFLVCLIAGVVLVVLWAFMHTSTQRLVDEIKSQMPPGPAIQESPPDSVA